MAAADSTTSQVSRRVSYGGASEDASRKGPPEARALPCAEISSHTLEVLQTTYVSVFQTNQDETEYVMPFALRGTPLAKITEDSDYWDPNWCSLDDFLAKEVDEEALKREYHTLQQIEPDNKSVQKKSKMHRDNMSKYHKIREIFGPDSSYHPNQLVAKHHLPPSGLCQRDLMYRLACKVSELQELQSKGLLAMDPWDFIRWRYSLKIQERVTRPGQRADKFLRTLVLKLCDRSDPANNKFGDPVMREAVLLAAKYQNRLGMYQREKKPSGSRTTVPSKQSGSETTPTKRHGSGTTAPAKRSGSGTKVSSKRSGPGTTGPSKRARSIGWRSISHPRSRAQLSADALKARQRARQERCARSVTQSNIYQGCDAFTVQMQPGGGPNNKSHGHHQTNGL